MQSYRRSKRRMSNFTTSDNSLTIETAQKLAVCYLKGHLSFTTADYLVDYIKENADDIDTILLDFSEVITMSSSGIGVICKLSLDQMKTIIIVCPEYNELIRDYITDSGLTDIVVMKSTVAAAMQAVASKLEVMKDIIES
jgi:anti-anti-sigma factor